MYWLGDRRTRFAIIILKSLHSAVIYSFQDFEQEKSVKTEILFCY